MHPIRTLVAIGSLWLGLVLLCAAPQRVNQNTTYTVKYEVVGSITRSASLTFCNQQGGTEQQEVGLPWSKSFAGQPGAFLYISAQNRKDEGTIIVRIRINGRLIRESTSTGGYVIASADYRCCE